MAPELIQNPGQQVHGKEIDIWALGVIAYFLLSQGQYPFPGKTKEEINEKILNTEPDIDVLSCDENIKEFLRKCFVKDSNQRSTATDLLH